MTCDDLDITTGSMSFSGSMYFYGFYSMQFSSSLIHILKISEIKIRKYMIKHGIDPIKKLLGCPSFKLWPFSYILTILWHIQPVLYQKSISIRPTRSKVWYFLKTYGPKIVYFYSKFSINFDIFTQTLLKKWWMWLENGQFLVKNDTFLPVWLRVDLR